MGKKASVPEYSSATYNSGLFGTATADKDGVTANPAGWMNRLSNTTTKYMPKTVNLMQSTLGNILSGDYLNDANFKAYKNNFNRQAKDTFDTAVLGSLADRNLFGSSGMQALNDSYQNAMNNNLTNLMDNYYNRQVSNYGLINNNLGSLLNTQNALFNWITGNADIAQKQANAVSGYNAQKAQIENQSRGNLFGQLMGAAGSIGGGVLGSMVAPGVGTAVGSSLGGMLGSSGGSALGGGGNYGIIGNAANNYIGGVPMTSYQLTL